VHIIAVCQPSVPVMGAAALMAMNKDPRQPKSINPDGRADRHQGQPDHGPTIWRCAIR